MYGYLGQIFGMSNQGLGAQKNILAWGGRCQLLRFSKEINSAATN